MEEREIKVINIEIIISGNYHKSIILYLVKEFFKFRLFGTFDHIRCYFISKTILASLINFSKDQKILFICDFLSDTTLLPLYSSTTSVIFSTGYDQRRQVYLDSSSRPFTSLSFVSEQQKEVSRSRVHVWNEKKIRVDPQWYSIILVRVTKFRWTLAARKWQG